MQTLLVLFALEILAPQLENLSIVQPEEAADDDSEGPGDNNRGPLGLVPDMSGARLLQPGDLVFGEIGVLGPVDGYQDTAADDGEDEEDVATHPSEAQEDCRIQASERHHIRFAHGP